MAEEPTTAPQQNGHIDQAAANGNSAKKSKVDKKKEKRQKQKHNRQQRRQQQQQYPQQNGKDKPPPATSTDEEDIVIEYVAAPAPDITELLQPADSTPADSAAEDGVADQGPSYGGLGLGATPGLGLGFTRASEQQEPQANTEEVMEQFKRVLERFLPQEASENADAAEANGEAAPKAAETAGPAQSDADSDEEGEGVDEGSKLSKKQRKLLHRLKIAELKQQCPRPDVVEVWDVTAPDPQTLVTLKALRNTVSVPRHWSQKRKYLQGKRGIEKPPFKLPDFIEATGITEMRNAYMEKEQAKKLKQKQRDRMTAKTGKMDIAYEVLYDAFFKHQRKPKMSVLGELYYEGKEYEAKLEHLRPGVLSNELREALGMSETSPPPWLVNMQRYGPPPSYPNLKIPGLNAPIPPGASFGYHAGGWGKPPVDSDGNPLYGDVFGLAQDDGESDAEVEKGARWGELEEYEEASEEEEESEEPELPPDEEGAPSEADIIAGIATDATGISSLQSGLETPDVALNLRKTTDSVAGTESAQAPQLYTVLEQRKASMGGGLLGTDHTYVIPGAETAVGGKRRYVVALSIGANFSVYVDTSRQCFVHPAKSTCPGMQTYFPGQE
eukprot:GHRR01011581.1.p1 GENE.GHRR01011581.1~~GHRR01011581.1.p1  ORF type:complete len:612 (+),score=229.72 GHRR01011581.1:240-2075(+)